MSSTGKICNIVLATKKLQLNKRIYIITPPEGDEKLYSRTEMKFIFHLHYIQ